MSRLRCRPGDLCRIVGMPPQLAGLNDCFVKLADRPPYLLAYLNDCFVKLADRPPYLNDCFVKLADRPPYLLEGDWTWDLVESVDVCLLGNARQAGRMFYIGETVVVDSLQDKFLRPIRDGEGDDETLAWAGKPAAEPVALEV